MPLLCSIIIPVYNRPKEMQDILSSIVAQNYEGDFEVVVVEDGSTEKAEAVVAAFQGQLKLSYYYKENEGAGKARNFGMSKAKSDFFIILDSDCILPKTYLDIFAKAYQSNPFHFFGGPDAAHQNFSPFQKAVSYAMTSFLTTGGLRGHKNNKDFQPRSFNLGVSKEAFQACGGFKAMPIGEDIDLSFRLKALGYHAIYLSEAVVFHKRRTHLKAYFKQTFKFGKARPLLNLLHKGTAKLTYWFPSLFVIGLFCALFLALVFHFNLGLFVYAAYLLAILLHASLVYKKSCRWFFKCGHHDSIFGYGFGFLKGLLSNKS